jgi:hypothetical protein
VDIKPVENNEFLSSGTPDSMIPRDLRDILADELTLRDFDRGYYTMAPPPGVP